MFHNHKHIEKAKGRRLHGGQGLTPIKPVGESYEGEAGGVGGTCWFDSTFLVEGQLFA
jgi:hypothetical protein